MPVFSDSGYHSLQLWKPCWFYLFLSLLAPWFETLAGGIVGILPALPDILTLPFRNIAWEHFWGMKGLHTLDCIYIADIFTDCIVQAGCIQLWFSSSGYTKFLYRFWDAQELAKGILQGSPNNHISFLGCDVCLGKVGSKKKITSEVGKQWNLFQITKIYCILYPIPVGRERKFSSLFAISGVNFQAFQEGSTEFVPGQV